MSTIRTRMEQILGEKETDAPSEDTDLSVKKVIPQLVLAMQALGLDTSDEEQLDQFLKMLKVLATSKSQMVKTAIKHWSGSKATRALRVAKKSV